MENKIKTIIQKVRDMYKYDPDKKEVVAHKASVEFKETKNGDIALHSITFSWYDNIYVYDTGIIYSPDHKNARKILEYKDWDELINM